MLYYAVEEALECEKIGHYSAGILTFSLLLNLFKKKTPQSRHIVAHKLLRQRPTKQMFAETVEAFQKAASEQSDYECGKYESIEDYQQSIIRDWKEFIKRLHRI